MGRGEKETATSNPNSALLGEDKGTAQSHDISNRNFQFARIKIATSNKRSVPAFNHISRKPNQIVFKIDDAVCNRTTVSKKRSMYHTWREAARTSRRGRKSEEGGRPAEARMQSTSGATAAAGRRSKLLTSDSTVAVIASEEEGASTVAAASILFLRRLRRRGGREERRLVTGDERLGATIGRLLYTLHKGGTYLFFRASGTYTKVIGHLYFVGVKSVSGPC